jgi:hypothetical protein
MIFGVASTPPKKYFENSKKPQIFFFWVAFDLF